VSTVKGHLKILLGDSVVYGLSSVITRFISVLLIPIYTRIFTPADYGVLNLTNITFFLISLFLVFALDNAVARWYYEKDDITFRKQAFAGWFWFQATMSLLVMTIMLLASSWFSKILFDTSSAKINIIVPAIGLLFSILPNMITNWFRVQRKAKSTAIFTLLLSLTTIMFSILFVVVLKWGVTGALSAVAAANFIFSIVAFIILKSWIKPGFFNWPVLRDMIKFATPYIPAALAFWLMNSSAGYFIKYFSDKSEVGLFTIGTTIASATSLLTGAFQQAWGPFAFSLLGKPNAQSVYAKVGLIYAIVASIVGLFIMLFAPDILTVFTTQAYVSAAWVAGLLSYNLILIGLSYIATIGVSLMKNTTAYGVAVVAGSVVTIILFYLLIPHFKKEGAAVAIVVGQLLVPVYLFYQSQKIYFIPYKFLNLAIVLLGSLALGVTIRYFFNEISGTNLIIKALVFLGFLIFVVLLQKKEFAMLIQVAKRYLPKKINY
jgi:O-antigen/teichoic acid export membrane protein